MGLRSRKRRLAGLTDQDTYDPEGMRHLSGMTLEQHIAASKSDMDQLWSKYLNIQQISMTLLSIYLVYVHLYANNHGKIFESKNLLLLGLSFLTLFSTWKSITTTKPVFPLLVCCIGTFHLCVWLLMPHQKANNSPQERPSFFPLTCVYALISLLSMRFMGANKPSSADQAREAQLDKLEQLFHQE